MLILIDLYQRTMKIAPLALLRQLRPKRNERHRNWRISGTYVCKLKLPQCYQGMCLKMAQNTHKREAEQFAILKRQLKIYANAVLTHTQRVNNHKIYGNSFFTRLNGKFLARSSHELASCVTTCEKGKYRIILAPDDTGYHSRSV